MINKDSLAYKVYSKMMEKDYCSQWMDLRPIIVEEGHCKMSMVVKKEMLNGHGILHGGIAFSFADSVFAFASNSYGRVALSINGSMNYAGSAKIGDKLMAEATALNVSYKKADFDVNIWKEGSSEILYYFRGTVYRKSEEVVSINPELNEEK